jgi:hypothetical protein
MRLRGPAAAQDGMRTLPLILSWDAVCDGLPLCYLVTHSDALRFPRSPKGAH